MRCEGEGNNQREKEKRIKTGKKKDSLLFLVYRGKKGVVVSLWGKKPSGRRGGEGATPIERAEKGRGKGRYPHYFWRDLSKKNSFLVVVQKGEVNLRRGGEKHFISPRVEEEDFSLLKKKERNSSYSSRKICWEKRRAFPPTTGNYHEGGENFH